MTLRRLAAMTVVLVIGVAVGRSTGSAAGDEEQKQAEALAVQCAAAELKLAEMNLARAQELNKKVPGTLVRGMMQQFSDEVDRAKTELEIAKKAPQGDPYQACIERVKLDLRTAEARAKEGLETHERAPTVVTKNDVERMRLVAIIADLQLQRGMSLANAPAEEKLKWQFEILSDDVDNIRVFTYLLGQNRIGQFFPGGL